MKETLKERKELNEKIKALIVPYIDKIEQRVRAVERLVAETTDEVRQSTEDVVDMEYEEIISRIRRVIQEEAGQKKALLERLLEVLKEE